MTGSNKVLGPLIAQLFSRADCNMGKVYECPLARGLTVLVKQEGDGRFKLGLMRPDVYPSETEILTVTADLPFWVSKLEEWQMQEIKGKYYRVTWLEKVEYLVPGKG